MSQRSNEKYSIALRELKKLRDQIKNNPKYFTSDNRTPTVCTDESLEEMARKLPFQVEDFKSIKGLGSTFVEKYGELFLIVTKKLKYEENKNTEVRISKKEINILKKLSNRLIDINRKNKMLYLASLKKKDTLDLFGEIDINQLNEIINGKAINICSRLRNNEPNENFKIATSIYRESNRIFREKGQNKLYIAYNFLIGKAQGEDFNYRAPLIFLPVILENNTENFTIKVDSDRDAIINSHLIIANNKFNKRANNIEDNAISEMSCINEILNQASLKYSNNNLTLDFVSSNEINKFLNYSGDSFPTFENGDLEVESCLVLGLFSVFANSIAYDFSEIINNGQINRLISNLITEIDKTSTDTDFSGYFEEIEKLTIREEDITYINDLNSSQEKVLKALKNKEALVIEGPPGTGKSQTITSLITHNIYQGKNVLLVSEKKAALDVVYSRLGDLNKYAIMIDDLNNKSSFYDQLKVVLSQKKSKSSERPFDYINMGIDVKITNLNHIASTLYSQNKFGLEVYKCYSSKQFFRYPDKDDKLPYKLIEENIYKSLVNLNYQEVRNQYNLIKNSIDSDRINAFVERLMDYNWIINLKNNLNFEDLEKFKEKINFTMQKVKRTKAMFPRFSFLLSFPLLLRLSKEIDSVLILKPKKWMRSLYNNPDLFNDAFFNSYELLKNHELFFNLDSVSKDYIFLIIKLCNITKLSIDEVNNKLYNYYLFKQVQDFERHNKNVLTSIDSFDKIVDEIKKEIENKKVITKSIISENLSDAIYSHLITSKNANTLNARVNSKRRMSVNTFIKNYQFELFNGIKIWLMTPEVVSDLFPLTVGLLDVVIFDEASQMYIERGIPTILRAKQVIIAGDSKQLRPSKLGAGRIGESDYEENEESEIALDEESLLDVAKAKYYPPVPLTYHYRSKFEELINFSNYAFYGGRLNVSPNTVVSDKPPIEYIKVNGKWISKKNTEEAKKVTDLVKQILETRKENESIGVVTFNSTQRDEILDQLDDLMRIDVDFATKFRMEENRKDHGEDTGIFVKNIENVQGDERDIIIFSIAYGRDDRDRVAVNFGWLSNEGGENRLNVAITRAKKKVYIVASISGEDLDVSRAKNVGPKFFKNYLIYSEAISNRDYEKAYDLLKSFGDAGSTLQIEFDSGFEEGVYNALRELNIDVDTQVGVGGYRIDMAIKHNGNYILGIECDGKLYHSSKDARERDYHRQKYLESRGWKIHRIWSTHWWQDPVNEIKKVQQKLKEMV